MCLTLRPTNFAYCYFKTTDATLGYPFAKITDTVEEQIDNKSSSGFKEFMDAIINAVRKVHEVKLQLNSIQTKMNDFHASNLFQWEISCWNVQTIGKRHCVRQCDGHISYALPYVA